MFGLHLIKKFAEIFQNRTYVLLLTINSTIYTSSLISFKNNPNQHVYFGPIKSKEFDALEQLHKYKIKTKN
jgi:hypothetical protein